MDEIKVFAGFDEREAIAYHVFSQSVITTASVPVSLHPLHVPMLAGFDGQRDGSNAFTFSRYLIPNLCSYKGWAIFADGDMVVTRDIKELYDLRDESKAVMVVKHNYTPKEREKYVGSTLHSPNTAYPRKNWSSVMLFNCAHPSNAVLTEDYLSAATPKDLHRLSWLKDEEIGELPATWTYLVREQAPASAALYHYTLGIPGLAHYADDYGSWHWHTHLLSALSCAGESAVGMVSRSKERMS